MIKLTIEGVAYHGIDRWEELTLSTYLKMCAVEIPSRLRDLLEASMDLNQEDPVARADAEKVYNEAADRVTKRDLLQTFPQYYGELMEILTDIPHEVIDRIDISLRRDFFDEYIRYIILSTFFTQPVMWNGENMIEYFPGEMIESFELDGEELLLPKTLRIYNDPIALADEPVLSFAEASEIEIAWHDLKEKGVVQLPMLIALYCRPKGEAYNQRKVLIREKKMHTITMDVVWSVFLCIARLQGKYKPFILRSTRKAVQELKRI